jgi:hypothetical protein
LVTLRIPSFLWAALVSSSLDHLVGAMNAAIRTCGTAAVAATAAPVVRIMRLFESIIGALPLSLL